MPMNRLILEIDDQSITENVSIFIAVSSIFIAFLIDCYNINSVATLKNGQSLNYSCLCCNDF